jgi:prolycopene isomerase
MTWARRLSALALSLVFCVACGKTVVSRSAEPRYDVVVIGAGGGGLAASAMLSRRGAKVLLLEQGSAVGGYMNAFERPPYTFEVSLHAMDGPDEGGRSRLLFEQLGILDRVRPVRLETAYRAIYPDHAIDVPADIGEYRLELKRLFPGESAGIDRFFEVMNDMYTAVVWKNLEGAGDGRGAGLAVAGNPRFWTVFFKYGRKSFGDLLDDCTRDRKLKATLSWLSGYIGASPGQIPSMQVMGMWASYHNDGFYYFQGGSRSVAEALADVLLENGGVIELGSRARKIEIEDGKAVAVRTQDGSRYACRFVVSNASATSTLLDMVGIEHLPRRYARDLSRMKVGPSIFQIYLGVDHDYTPLFGKTHTMSVFDSYDPDVYLGSGQGEVNPEELGFYLANFSVVDPLAAPPGKNVIEITSYLPYGWEDGWRVSEGAQAHRRLKEGTAAAFVRRAQKYLPGLLSHVEVMEIGTPITMERYTLNPEGSVYGWAAGQSMGSGSYSMPRRTPIPNLYLASAWCAGGGQSNVIAVGVNVARDILATLDDAK